MANAALRGFLVDISRIKPAKHTKLRNSPRRTRRARRYSRKRILHSEIGFGEMYGIAGDFDGIGGRVARGSDVATLRRSNVGGVRNSPVEGNCLSPSFDAGLERNSFKQLSSSTFELGDADRCDVVMEE